MSEKYLIVITTVLVLTQIIRIIQNAINLHIQNNKIKKNVNWILKNDVSEKDFETQRRAMNLLVKWLEIQLKPYQENEIVLDADLIEKAVKKLL